MHEPAGVTVVAQWLVLEDFAGALGGPTNAQIIGAGALLDDTQYNIPTLLSQGLPLIPYDPATMQDARDAFFKQDPGVASVSPDGNMLALLISFGALGGGGSGIITFRPNAPATPPLVYNTWESLMAKVQSLAAVGAAVNVECDFSLSGGQFQVPAGAWNFGGKAVISGGVQQPIPFQQILRCGPGVKLVGLLQVTRLLTIRGENPSDSIIDLPQNGIFILSLGASLSGLSGPVIRPVTVGFIASIVTGGISNNGAPPIDIPAGRGLSIFCQGASEIQDNAVSGAGILSRNIGSLGTGAINNQVLFTGTQVWDAFSVNLVLQRFVATTVGNVASTQVFLPSAGAGPASPTDDFPWVTAPIFSPKLITAFQVAYQGAGVGDPMNVEILINGSPVVQFLVPASSPNTNIFTINFGPSNAIVVPPGSVVSCRVTTPATWTSSPTNIQATLLGVA